MWALLALTALVGMTGCGSGTKPDAPAVPGGAPVKAVAGTPAYCSALVASAPLRELNTALTGLATDKSATDARQKVRGAGLALATIGVKVDGRLARTFGATAAALKTLATRGLTDARATDRVDRALGRLGRELQGRCDFPLG
jgi:hypothetical protein